MPLEDGADDSTGRSGDSLSTMHTLTAGLPNTFLLHTPGTSIADRPHCLAYRGSFGVALKASRDTSASNSHDITPGSSSNWAHTTSHSTSPSTVAQCVIAKVSILMPKLVT